VVVLYDGCMFQLEVVIEQAHRVQPDLPNLIPSKEKVLDKLIFEFKEIVTVNAVDADTKQVQCCKYLYTVTSL